MVATLVLVVTVFSFVESLRLMRWTERSQTSVFRVVRFVPESSSPPPGTTLFDRHRSVICRRLLQIPLEMMLTVDTETFTPALFRYRFTARDAKLLRLPPLILFPGHGVNPPEALQVSQAFPSRRIPWSNHERRLVISPGCEAVYPNS